MHDVYVRALKRAAELVGGENVLCDLLQVPMHRLDAWLMGWEVPPMGVFLKAVDVISGGETPQQSRPDEAGIQRAGDAARRAAELHASILSVPPLLPGARKPRSVLAFLHEKFRSGDGRAMVESALDAAVEGTGADRGNVQLVRPDGLVIVAQRGFDTPFLQFFSCVGTEGTCGTALRYAERVVVNDVQSDPIFSDGAIADVMEQAHVRAVQSTPLVCASGEIIGILSTHYEKPRQPSAMEFDVLDRIAERTAYWLNGGAV